MNRSTHTPRTWPLSAGLAAVLSLGACSAVPDGEPEKLAGSPSATAPGTGTTSTAPGNDTGGRYRDGKYTADKWYGGLPSRIGVSLTISDDTMTDIDISTPATDDTSLDYQRRFADAAPAIVVGKSLDEVQWTDSPVPAAAPTGSTTRLTSSASRQPRTDCPAQMPACSAPTACWALLRSPDHRP